MPSDLSDSDAPIFTDKENDVFERCQKLNDRSAFCNPDFDSSMTDAEQEKRIALNLKRIGITAKFIP